jgi:hypothetical protein
MKIAEGLSGLLLIFVALWDGFETIVLPRRVRGRVRLARLFYNGTWAYWSAAVRRVRSGDRRDNLLSYYGPLSLILLLAVWAVMLVLGFALVHWGCGSKLGTSQAEVSFSGALYMSGSTFFTLGMGDVTSHTGLGRFLTVAESGTGIAFLALVIGYLPVIYQAFSRREITITMLDARAGSPPSAVELLRRYAGEDAAVGLAQFVAEWERWASELLESHLSYPVLAYYRSQHDSQSWLASLTTVLDVCALMLVGLEGIPDRSARLGFAMARHAAVDLSQILGTPPRSPAADRLPPADLARLRAVLAASGYRLREGPDADEKLLHIRAKYEPYANALAEHLLIALPPWIAAPDTVDNWQTSVYEHASAPIV